MQDEDVFVVVFAEEAEVAEVTKPFNKDAVNPEVEVSPEDHNRANFCSTQTFMVLY